MFPSSSQVRIIAEVQPPGCDVDPRDVEGRGRREPQPRDVLARHFDALLLPRGPTSSHRMYELNDFRKSTPPQNRLLCIFIGNSKQQIDDVVGVLTF